MKTTRSLSDAIKPSFHHNEALPPLIKSDLIRKRFSGPAAASYVGDDVRTDFGMYDVSKRSRSVQLVSQRDYYQLRKQRSMSSVLNSCLLETPLERLGTTRRRRRVNSVILENEILLKKYNITERNFDNDRFQQSEDWLSSDSSIRLEEHIKLHHLQKLLHIFKSHQPPVKNVRPGKEKGQSQEETQDPKQAPGMMNLQEFKDTISEMLGTARYNDKMEMLFHKMDTACDGYVDWNEFCTYMLLQMREIEHLQKMKLIPFASAAIIKQIFHNKQETTTKSLVVENPTRLLTVSKIGGIGVWDLDLRLLKTYNLSVDVAEDQQQATRKRFHTWVTDAVYMRNTQNVALTTSNREIYFYDISTSVYTIEFCLYAMPDVPMCAHYWYNKKARNGHSMLCYGDDTGAAHVLHFHSPQSRLFQKPFSPKQGMQRIYFNELKEHRKYVTYEHLGNIHDDVVRRIMYVPQSDVIISSSMSPTTSVVLMDMKRKKKPYIFKVNKGVECFDYSKSLNILVTGSLDHLVRVWNPYVVARPIVILQGHSTGICDVVINEAYSQIVTYSKNVVIKVWDFKEHSCIQTISPKFPSLQPGRIPEHGEFPLSLYGSPHDLITVTCNDSIAMLKMGKLDPKAELPTTHDASLCGAIYNPLFHQVVSASDDSTVSVWEVETGSRSLTFSNAHGQEEITHLSFDESCRRLFTGARDGTIKVWNFQNGNCLHELEAVEEAEVTGILSFQERNILSVGWSRKIAIYDDSDPDATNVGAKTKWKGGQLHEDDILAVAHGPPNLLATGSYDGCILVWNEETQQLYIPLRGPAKSLTSEESRPIDVLIFLSQRLRHAKKNRASLVSCESGTLYWWCLYGRRTLLGHFHAAETHEGSVLGISSSSDDLYLITGDTTGYVTVWDIEDYCVTDQTEEIITRKPPVAYHWRAHESAIVSVDFIDHELQAMVVTASTDKTARLWTLEGRFIGIFGQHGKWNLNKPTTYQYPKNPWGEIVEAPEPSHSCRRHEAAPHQNRRPDFVEKDLHFPQLNDINEVDGTSPTTKAKVEENDDVTSDFDVQEEGESSSSHDYINLAKADDNTDVIAEVITEQSKVDASTTSETTAESTIVGELPEVERFSESSRSKTFAAFEAPKKQKTKILGDIAESNLIRRTTTRQQRRHRVGYIDGTKTSRFGNLCSPFQALTIRDTESVAFDDEMPMTKRMVEKGMFCRNEFDLAKMPLGNLFEFNDAEQGRGQRRKGHQALKRGTLLPPIVTSSASSIASSQPAVTS
ncbi:cilia- and flagella-associated protein 337-like isoform X1 [Clavelina lepadiformis]|uniref:cilia- and flagella-associated protein 337-like isoform X1 n=1 Tax=Clavelina lepadiformis TaxID=159417 RepID=UPI004041332E